MRAPKTKVCSGCRQRRALSEYYRSRGSSDGLFPRCKRCCAASRRRSYLKDRERFLAYQRDYDAAHAAELAPIKKTYYRKHRARILEYHRAYYERHREKLLEYGRKWREARKLSAGPVRQFR